MEAHVDVAPELAARTSVAAGEAAPQRAPLRPARATAAAALALTAAALVLAREPLSAWGVAAAAAAAVLVWLAAIDLEARLVPNRIVLPAAAALLGVAFAIDTGRGVEHALGAVGAGAFLLLAALLRPGSLGMGDVKLGALLGALLGGGVLEALTIGFVLVGSVGLVFVVRDGRSALARQLPLVPFLAAGAIVTLLVG